MLFDRYYQYALIFLGYLLLSTEVKSALLSLGMALAVPIFFIVMWMLFSQSVSQSFSARKARGLRNLRWLKAHPNKFGAKAKTLRAARNVIKGYGLTFSLQADEDPRLQKLMQDVSAQENTAMLLFSAPLTAGWLGDALAQAGKLSAAQKATFIHRLKRFSPNEPRVNRFIEMLWARNRWLSHIIAPKSDYDWINHAYNVGLGEMIKRDGNKRLILLMLAITRRREDAGMRDIAEAGNPIRALRPREQRDIVLLARLLRVETTLSTIRLTDPSRLRLMSSMAAGIANDPPLPLEVLNPTKASADREAMRAAYTAQEEAREKARPPVFYGPPNPFKAKAELEAAALNAVYLKRLWPVGTPHHGNSHLGGRPSLPAHTPWPRHTINNLPLHFLAQIDCAEMPNIETPTPLPPDGVLLFFADIETDMSWRGDTTDTRVLYVPAAQQVPDATPVPTDLPDIMHYEGKETGVFARPGNKTYPYWPVTGHKMRSYETEYIHANWLKSDMAEELHYAEIRHHLPPPPRKKPPNLIEKTEQTDAVGIPLRDPDGHPLYVYKWVNPVTLDPRFPFCGAVMHSFMQRMIEKPAMDLARESSMPSYYRDRAKFTNEADRARSIAQSEEKIAALTKHIAALKAVATKWQIVPEYACPGPTLSQEFRNWILANAAAAKHPLYQGLHAAAQRAVTDPRLLELLPDSLFAAVDRFLRPTESQSQHIVLGHPQNKTNSTQGQGVRLLLLDSDLGVDFVFGDAGVIEFYIAPEDLANRDFSRAYANTAGG